jgi:Tfp pilus assembly protein PilE
MGQQQLLLIILGVIVVGIAVAVGITMFSDSAISANRDALTNDLVNLASRAQQYYRRPTSLGGGGNVFTNLALQNLTNSSSNANGVYSLTAVTATQVTIDAYGTEQVNGQPTHVQVLVWASRDSIIVQN